MTDVTRKEFNHHQYVYKIYHTQFNMEEELTHTTQEPMKENGKKEFRQSIRCEKCDSRFVYVKVNGDIQCRRCRHLTATKKEDME